MSFSSVLKNEIKTFSPGYFALVMATGIISTSCQQLQYEGFATFLFILNNIQYCLLLFTIIARLIFFFPEVKIDLSNHSKGAGFLTFVAGSSILGTEYVQGKHLILPGLILLIIAFISWLILIYSFLSSVILKREKPSLETGINGSWLLMVVSTQSLVILGTSLALHVTISINLTLFVALSGWLGAIALYLILVTIIIYRLTFFPVSATEVTPSYWIDSGAAAISTVAGLTLANQLLSFTFFQQFIPFVNLFSLLFWSTATFWLPLLIILETWRHFKVGFAYSAGYWSLVFPLGMYTFATFKLATALKAHFLVIIAHIFIFIAITAWTIVFIGMLVKIYKNFILEKGPKDSQ